MPSKPSSPSREMLLRIPLETFDRYIRASAVISAESGLPAPSIEVLMAYCLCLPESDEIIHSFLQGDRESFADQLGPLLERDIRRLELDPAERRQIQVLPVDAPGLEQFIQDNRQIFRQVESSPKLFLVRWIMLHLMEHAQARNRGKHVIQEFITSHPRFSKCLLALSPKSSDLPQRL